MKIPLSCDMLVDQGRKIGGDPVGYKCGNAAVETIELGGRFYLICNMCRSMDVQRLTGLPICGGETPELAIENSTRRMQAVIDHLLVTQWLGFPVPGAHMEREADGSISVVRPNQPKAKYAQRVESRKCDRCGKHSVQHYSGEVNLCCVCYVNEGNPPADWHRLCMETYANIKEET